MLRRLAGFSLLLAVTVGCSHDETASAHPRNASSSIDDGVPPRPSVIAPTVQPYKVVAVANGGTVTGTVDFDGTPPAQPVIHPPSDQKICGNTIAEKTVALSGTRVGDAVVWITDIRSGKAFPLQRRYELSNDNCTLDPYVQVISTTGTLNVSNDDRTLATNRFINVGTGQIAGIAPFNDDGEVVPLDKLKEPAEIEVVCEEHPWTHAWIAVLDHPYYAQTSATGTFTIDDVPPGRYRIRAWHPVLGFADDSVTVTAGQQATVAFRIRPTAATAPTVPTQPKSEPAAASTTAPAVPVLPTASSTSASSTPANPPPR
ncbi:MAG: carboxypeptidase regulatory-like domain-containing protein [Gemmatimonadaceae bacterium]